MLAEMSRQRYEGLGVMAGEAAKTGQLKVSERECRDFMWATTDATLWHQLVGPKRRPRPGQGRG
jgi:hypothetical protein